MPSTYNQHELRQPRDNHNEQGSGNNNGGGYGANGSGPNGGGPRPRYNRTTTETQPHHNGYRNGEQNVYPAVNNHRSYETVASGSGASGGEPAGYQTDPTSSDNSSIERRQSPLKQQYQPHMQQQQKPTNDYGIGFTQNNAYQPSSFAAGPGGNAASKLFMSQTPGSLAPPPVPTQQGGGSVLRKTTTQQTASTVVDKRKSWFSRKLTRKS